MRTSAPLQFVNAGTLAAPGPVGRWLRAVLGALCLFALFSVVQHLPATTSHPVATLDARWPLLLAPLCVFNYVVNIGFGRDWGTRPLIVSVAALAVAAAAALLVTGAADSPILGVPLNLWLSYFYAHLGVSFLLAALLATPGCEMRAIAQLLGRLGGRSGAEHHCPVALLGAVDAWEARRRAQRS